jgi:hypothetical protein
MKRTMQIGEMAQATGLSRDTLRFYEKQGLLRARRARLTATTRPGGGLAALPAHGAAAGLYPGRNRGDMPLLASAGDPPRRNCCARRWRASWAISMRASRA